MQPFTVSAWWRSVLNSLSCLTNNMSRTHTFSSWKSTAKSTPIRQYSAIGTHMLARTSLCTGMKFKDLIRCVAASLMAALTPCLRETCNRFRSSFTSSQREHMFSPSGSVQYSDRRSHSLKTLNSPMPPPAAAVSTDTMSLSSARFIRLIT